MMTVAEELQRLAAQQSIDVFSEDFPKHQDQCDPLSDFRKKFCYPLKKNLPKIDHGLDPEDLNEECVYLCGHSLGLKPRGLDQRIQDQLDKWGRMGVYVHFQDPLPAALCENYGRDSLGRLVGAHPDNVLLMNTLTVNLHLLLISFYQPTQSRHKIVIEKSSFPSDRYAMRSQISMRGFDPEESLILLEAREGEYCLRTEDILSMLEREGDNIAVMSLSALDFYTGQKYDMKTITSAAQEHGCIVGWDLAHAIGNVEVKLDEWGVDFACWCTYKYLNSGPGCIGGAYVNSRHRNRGGQLKGWFSSTPNTRFLMLDHIVPSPGIDGFKISNTSPMAVACVLSSLEIFDEAGLSQILSKQRLLTGYLELLLTDFFSSTSPPLAQIITPADHNERGCQLSIVFRQSMESVHDQLTALGVVCDVRRPSVMRVSPAPLYNSFMDVYKFVCALKDALKVQNGSTPDVSLKEG